MVAVITTAGTAWFADHVNAGSSPMIKSVEVGTGQYTPAGTETALRTPYGPRRNFALASVERLVAGQVGIRAVDASDDTYTYSERAIWGASATVGGSDVLVAIESVASGNLGTKPANSDLAMAVAIPFTASQIAALTWQVTVPLPATETTFGTVEYADATEAVDETVADRAMTPQRTREHVDAWSAEQPGLSVWHGVDAGSSKYQVDFGSVPATDQTYLIAVVASADPGSSGDAGLLIERSDDGVTWQDIIRDSDMYTNQPSTRLVSVNTSIIATVRTRYIRSTALGVVGGHVSRMTVVNLGG